MKKIFLLFAVCVSALIANAQNAQKDTITIAAHYQTSKYDCAIFPASYKGSWLSDAYSAGRFTPSHAQVDLVERKIKENSKMLDSMSNHQDFPEVLKHLKKYKRQYFGYIDANGHRIIFINGLYPTAENEYDTTFRQALIKVCDGGWYYWQAWFDVDTGKFTAFHINGNA